MTASAPQSATKHCLVGVDGSPQSKQAFEYAMQWAHYTGGRLSVLSVVHTPAIVMAEPEERPHLIRQEIARLECFQAALRRLADDEGLTVDCEIQEGKPCETLLAHAGAQQVDLIVIGHHGKGPIESFMLGSVAKGIVDGARCTVTVTR